MSSGGVEVWGGVECTLNRVGDRYFDQCHRSGHWTRDGDLERFAALGISALRFPMLWEHVAPGRLDEADWSWGDRQLPRLGALGIRPIVGLVHHGSGPRDTHLLDPDFPSRLARYARAVAERHPEVVDYTPVNEPLTTARFAGLYGHWYPHHRDDGAFVRALIVQCRAVVEAMHAIREVNPRARLVQTEDMGVTYSTPRLEYQAAFENERRWLSLDLLCGRVTAAHPLRGWLMGWGAREEDLAFFEASPTPPDVIGLNYYLTSDRYLDERLERFPRSSYGGNGRDAYADVEAVRALTSGIAGHATLLRRAWARYRLPIAFTEVHAGCTREDQLRWLKEAWEAVGQARREGIDARAVTVWALLGSYDWNSLVTEERGHYEPGAFDLRSADPRPTAVAKLTRSLADGCAPSHPTLESPGWWRRRERLLFQADDGVSRNEATGRVVAPPPILIFGAGGRLGRAFTEICAQRGIAVQALPRTRADIASRDEVEAALLEHAPWAVINAAGFTDPVAAEREPAACFRQNTLGPAVLAQACRRHGVRLVTFTSERVFAGTRDTPYVESNALSPTAVLGQSQADAEEAVRHHLPDALIVRTSALFDPWTGRSWLDEVLERLARGETVEVPARGVVSPTYVPDLVHATLDLLIDTTEGCWHLTHGTGMPWLELAKSLAVAARFDPDLVVRGTPSPLSLLRPSVGEGALGSQRGRLLPGFHDALSRFIVEREHCRQGWLEARGAESPRA